MKLRMGLQMEVVQRRMKVRVGLQMEVVQK